MKISRIFSVLFLIIFILSLLAVTGFHKIAVNYFQGDPPVPKNNETVMLPNSTIQATTITGTIIIKSGNGLKRYYTWEDATRSVVMWPRKERWNGSLGIYYPGPGNHWFSHNGISRCVAEEGILDFANMDEALKWIDERKKWLPLVYRDDGLVVCFGKSLQRKQINVEVWQITINGVRPEKLPE